MNIRIFFIFLFISAKVQAMEQNQQLVEQYSENSSITNELSRPLNDASITLTRASKVFVGSCLFSVVLGLWGIVDKTFNITPFADFEIGLTIGSFVQSMSYGPGFAKLDLAITQAQQIIAKKQSEVRLNVAQDNQVDLLQ